MGRRRYYSDDVANRASCPSDGYRTQPERRLVHVIEQSNGTGATCQDKSVNRKGLYEDIVEFLMLIRVVSGCALSG